MITDGYEADPVEVRAIVDQLVDVEDRSDPTLLYIQATKMSALYSQVVVELAALRAQAAARLHNKTSYNMSYARIGAHLGLSAARAQQLCERAAKRDPRT